MKSTEELIKMTNAKLREEYYTELRNEESRYRKRTEFLNRKLIDTNSRILDAQQLIQKLLLRPGPKPDYLLVRANEILVKIIKEMG